MKVYKNLNKILDDIFSKKHLKKIEVDKKSLEKLENESKNLIQKKFAPISFCQEYINEIKQKTTPELLINVEKKKIQLFERLNEIKINDKISPNKNILKVNVKDFNISEFRKEFQLTEEEFPDEILKKTYISCKGNINNMLLKLIK